ncbi:hypothetical protein BT69DRAFT_1353117 [Atractiella rhizophila]|nr:hypothetical protein BT69DRAFT_1353117 [Atractiella rhizophila]
MAATSSLAPSLALIGSSKLIKQGAEAKIYISPSPPPPIFSSSSKAQLTSPGTQDGGLKPILLKHRFAKSYRHPTLDSQLTKARIQHEVRALVRCARFGIRVPGVRLVDERNGVIGLELIDGASVREVLGGSEEDADADEHAEGQWEIREEVKQLREIVDKDELMRLVGSQIAKLHLVDMIHGDLTTSNMMVRLHNGSSSTKTSSTPSAPGSKVELVLIDFGLSSHSSSVEDKAVDLYVLERAFLSTHPDAVELFERVLDAYKEGMEREGKWAGVKKRLDESKTNVKI